MNRREILVHPTVEALSPAVQAALTRLTPVRFQRCMHVEDCGREDVVVSLSGDDTVPGRIARTGARCFHVTQGTSVQAVRAGDQVQFADSRRLDRMFRGRRLSHKPLARLAAVSVEPGDEVLAYWGKDPVWIQRDRHGASLDMVSVPVPQLTRDERPFDYLDGEAYMQLLPLLHFLRQASDRTGRARPALRACLMFDDPNLHWPSYGFIPFQKVVEEARRNGFHVAFATVPFDVWGLNREAVGLFRENSRHVSLLVHGNNHSRNELAQPRTLEGHCQILAQSLSRIARLESATGLKVDRIMAPPHEACAEAAATAMLALGFEGACLTPWMLRHWNPERPWPATFGLEMSELLDDGFPVIPRFRLKADCEGSMVISAYLGKPIIPVGHNCSVANGLELLSHLAQKINALGEVAWGSTEMIARSNYVAVRKQDTLRVTPYSCQLAVPVPDGVSELVVEAPADSVHAWSGKVSFQAIRSTQAQPTSVRVGTSFPVRVGETVKLISNQLGARDYRQFKSPGLSVGALARRLLCEARDRLAALKPRTRPLKAPMTT